MKTNAVTLFLVVTFAVTPTFAQGPLEPPGPPGPTMRSLDQIFRALGGSQLDFLGVIDPGGQGARGVIGLTRACQLEFGLEARVCTSGEVLTARNVVPASAWETPEGLLLPNVLFASSSWAVDVSGVEASSLSELTCGGWSDRFGTGLVVTRSPSGPGGSVATEGSFALGGCDDVGIACCGVPTP